MTDRPILFSAGMVRAILREIEAPGTGKTMTRRLLKPQPEPFWIDSEKRWSEVVIEHTEGRQWPRIRLGRVITLQEVRYTPGMRLWVRETWGVNSGPGVRCTEAARPNVALPSGGWSPVVFRATTDGYAWGMYGPPKWRPAIHMPRTASRLTLTVTAVKVERLQDISEQDAKAEGVDRLVMEGDGEAFYLDEIKGTYRCGFAGLWEHLNSKREGAGWDANPWCVAVTFVPELRNIDAAPAQCQKAEVA